MRFNRGPVGRCRHDRATDLPTHPEPSACLASCGSTSSTMAESAILPTKIKVGISMLDEARDGEYDSASSLLNKVRARACTLRTLRSAPCPAAFP